ncbi:MAG: RNA polymerase sigma factor [Saprospirales bacterium]|nr:RNA polymerase sigma factor [Saprospirales bacterium]MBK6903874.1 RNA polymerase sigma factor [Saprospirales bacterium]MBK7337539.1 RNA polymerase sigma factor [Saprospirales bacterium]
MTEEALIQGCRKQDRQAQKLLYERYAPVFFALCKRYVKTNEDAEDVMVEGFFKIMTRIDQYSKGGNFEGWMRRVMINESLMFLRKANTQPYTEEIVNLEQPDNYSIVEELAANDILRLLEKLPDGYRTIFNLYVLEGLKHREIADLLGISINTSKSQLVLAKRRMQELMGVPKT